MEEMDDQMLVRLAQQGEQEAFAELIRRHRAQAFGYARTLTRETFHAEDIVQDAVIRAFLHLGSLTDPSRFLPWLQRIVRNQAYSKLKRRSGSREKLFSELMEGNNEHSSEEGSMDMEAIFRRMSTRDKEAAGGLNPELQLLRQETVNMIKEIVYCLSPKERRIFESHVFEQLSPMEIAEASQLTTANVYQILSRSRKKVIQQHIRVVVDHYMESRRELVSMKKVQLSPKQLLQGKCSWTSAGTALQQLFSYTDQHYSLPYIMGMTGLAFRITIYPNTVHIAGPTSFHFNRLFTEGLRNLGFRARMVEGLKGEAGPNANLVDPRLLTPEAKLKRQLHSMLPAALELIHSSIDKGLPVLTWDMFIPEFGIADGYDDEKQELHVLECGKKGNVAFEHLGRGILEDLFVLALDGTIEISTTERIRGALRLILDHYHGRESGFEDCVHGLKAYETWMEAFRAGNIEPNGNAYNAAVIQEARAQGAAFLKELSESWKGDGERSQQIRGLCREASATYEQIADQLADLCVRFPFPAGGAPNEEAQAQAAIAVLQEVYELEKTAVGLLEQLLTEVDDLEVE
nr:sigma-70 family RNA polymerase sigma factor [Paenibacillus turpanensis]